MRSTNHCYAVGKRRFGGFQYFKRREISHSCRSYANYVRVELSKFFFHLLLAWPINLTINNIHLVPLLLKHRRQVAYTQWDEDGLRHIVWIGWICKDYVSFHLFSHL